jgi:hypothetical protein
MAAQVGGYVADAQLVRFTAIARGARAHARSLRVADGLPAVLEGRRELKQRVVREGGGRQRRDARCQPGPLDVAPFRHDRPFALPLAQRDPVLDDFGLVGIDVEGLAERVFGRGIVVRRLEDAADLLQGHGLVVDGIAVDRRQDVDEPHPFAHRAFALALGVEQRAEIDIGRIEIGLQPDGRAEGIDGARRVAKLAQHDAIVEIDRMEHGVIRVVGDPGLVEIGSLRSPAGGLQLLRALQHSRDIQLLRRGAIDGVGKQVGGHAQLRKLTLR